MFTEESTSTIEKKYKIQFLEKLKFVDNVDLGKINKKCRNVLWWSKYNKMNKWTCSLFLEDFCSSKNRIKVEVKEINDLVGSGVFALQNIPALTYLGEYTGLIRDRSKKDSDNDYIFSYLIGPRDTSWVIDAREMGNFTRFLNHKKNGNVTSRWMIVDGVSHIIFFSNVAIRKGDQITYDYGEYYWSARPNPVYL